MSSLFALLIKYLLNNKQEHNSKSNVKNDQIGIVEQVKSTLTYPHLFLN